MRLPKVMSEFDVHYGFRDVVDQQHRQTVPFGRLTKHDKKAPTFSMSNEMLIDSKLEPSGSLLIQEGLKNIQRK